MNLADLQRAADEMRTEIERAATLGALPPTMAEVDEFCGHVMDAENDKCETCDSVENFALAFERCVDRADSSSAVEAGEALAQLLMATGMMGSILTARTLVDRFASLVASELTREAA